MTIFAGHDGNSSNGVHTATLLRRDAHLAIAPRGGAGDAASVRAQHFGDEAAALTTRAIVVRAGVARRSPHGSHILITTFACAVHVIAATVVLPRDAALEFRCARLPATVGAASCCTLLCSAGTCFDATSPTRLTLTGLRLRGGAPTAGAGAGVAVTGTSRTLSVVATSMHFAGFSARAMELRAVPSALLASCTFVASALAGDGDGGALLIAESSSVALTSCTFRNNSVAGGGSGGAIAVRSSSTLRIAAMVCEHNAAGAHGGCLDAAGARAVSIESSQIRGNVAAVDGGGIRALYTPLAMNASTVEENRALGEGGGAHFLGDADTALASTAFVANRALGAAATGGAFRAVANSPSFTACTFTDNVAQRAGGLGYADAAGAATFTRSAFARNTPAGTDSRSAPCARGTASARADGAATCDPCRVGTIAPQSGASRCEPCARGTRSDSSGLLCIACAVGTYAGAGAATCAPCGAPRSMDCSGGVLKLVSGSWYDENAAAATSGGGLAGDTAVYACLNPAACTVVNGTGVECARHAGGPLCAVCDDGYVPDAAATDGRCKACASSAAERWSGKAALLACAALGLFLIALVVLARPAPTLKIDKLLGVLNAKRLARRVRKRILHRLNERDYGARASAFSTAIIVKSNALLDRNDIEAVVALRRAAMAASAAGNAAAAAGTPGVASGSAASLASVAHAAGHVGEQAAVIAEDRATQTLHDVLGAPDVDGSLEIEGVRRTSVVADGAAAAARAAAAGLLGDGGGEDLAAGVRARARSGAKGCLATATRLLEQASKMVSPGQVKIAVGNLQINASLTVVFSIPWPPVHTRFVNFLSVFKLDVFTGLSFAAPCLHSTHFMSLASFVAAPLLVVGVLALAYGAVALVGVALRRAPRKVRRTLRKLPMCHFTFTSARTAAIKVAIVVVLFIYPTICSKVFMTFKCAEAGGKKYMVADMAYACYEGEWLLWAAVSVAAMAVCA